MNEQVKALRLHLWEVTNEAMFLSWDKTPLSQQDVTALGEQLGALTRFLARRHIYPLDDTCGASPAPKENEPYGKKYARRAYQRRYQFPPHQ